MLRYVTVRYGSTRTFQRYVTVSYVTLHYVRVENMHILYHCYWCTLCDQHGQSPYSRPKLLEVRLVTFWCYNQHTTTYRKQASVTPTVCLCHYTAFAALKFCFKTCVAMKFVDDNDDLHKRTHMIWISDLKNFSVGLWTWNLEIVIFL